MVERPLLPPIRESMRRRTDMRAVTGTVVVLAVLTAGGCMLPSLEKPTDASADGAFAPDASADRESAPEGESDTGISPGGGSGSSGDTGVSDETGGSPGGGSESSGDAGSSSDGPANDTPSFSEVKQLVVQDCVGCHSTGVGSGSNFQFPSENPSDAEFLDGLKGTAATPSGTPLLSPGAPDNSAIYLRTQPDPEWAQREMPTDDDGWQGDPAESESTLKRWIAGGAPSPDPSDL